MQGSGLCGAVHLEGLSQGLCVSPEARQGCDPAPPFVSYRACKNMSSQNTKSVHRALPCAVNREDTHLRKTHFTLTYSISHGRLLSHTHTAPQTMHSFHTHIQHLIQSTNSAPHSKCSLHTHTAHLIERNPFTHTCSPSHKILLLSLSLSHLSDTDSHSTS